MNNDIKTATGADLDRIAGGLFRAARSDDELRAAIEASLPQKSDGELLYEIWLGTSSTKQMMDWQSLAPAYRERWNAFAKAINFTGQTCEGRVDSEFMEAVEAICAIYSPLSCSMRVGSERRLAWNRLFEARFNYRKHHGITVEGE